MRRMLIATRLDQGRSSGVLMNLDHVKYITATGKDAQFDQSLVIFTDGDTLRLVETVGDLYGRIREEVDA